MDPKDAIERSTRATLVAEPAPAPWRAAIPATFSPADPLIGVLPLREYLRILRKHGWMILTVVAVMVTVVTVVTFRTKPVYQASARLEITGEMPELASLRELWAMMPTDEEFLQTQVRILQSSDLAIQIVRKLRLHELPDFRVRPEGADNTTPFTPAEEVRLIGAFGSGLGVQLIRSSRLVEVSYESTDPKLASQIVNELSDTYIQNNFLKKVDSTLRASKMLGSQLEDLKGKMEKSHEALVSYERKNQIFSLNEGQNVTLQKLGQLSQELTQAEAERMAKESQVQLVKSRRLDDLPAVAQNPMVQDLENRLSQIRNEYADARAIFGPNYPKVQRLEKQIEETLSQLDHEKQQVAKRIESEYQGTQKRETLLRKAVDDQKTEANLLNARLVEYSLLKREYETNQQLYESLLQRLKEATVSAGLQANNIHVVDRARPPLSPIRPRKALNIALSLIVGLVVGGVLALFNDYLDNSVKIPEEVEQLVNLPTLGVIPSAGSFNGSSRRALPSAQLKGQGSDLTTMIQPQSVVSEAYRALRTSILLSTSKHPPQTILITSGQPREGKTTTVLNLAITLAQRGDRVVLIDSDLRRPRVHRAFQMPNEVGLSSYLAGTATIDQLPRAAPRIPNLFVITSGPTPPNPAELLSSDPIISLFAELRRQFDFILMDSPPAITVTDSLILAAHADGVMLVAHGGVTTRESLRHTRKLMASVNARVIGVVLNNVNIRSVDYRYYYSYYYGDYYRHMIEGYGYGSEPSEQEKKTKRRVGA